MYCPSWPTENIGVEKDDPELSKTNAACYMRARSLWVHGREFTQGSGPSGCRWAGSTASFGYQRFIFPLVRHGDWKRVRQIPGEPYGFVCVSVEFSRIT